MAVPLFIYENYHPLRQYLMILLATGITSVVNCTHGTYAIPNFHPGRLAYYTFPISDWSVLVDRDDASILKLANPMVSSSTSHSRFYILHSFALQGVLTAIFVPILHRTPYPKLTRLHNMWFSVIAWVVSIH